MDLTQQPLEEVGSAPVIAAAAPPVVAFAEDDAAPELDNLGDGDDEDE